MTLINTYLTVLTLSNIYTLLPKHGLKRRRTKGVVFASFVFVFCVSLVSLVVLMMQLLGFCTQSFRSASDVQRIQDGLGVEVQCY